MKIKEIIKKRAKPAVEATCNFAVRYGIFEDGSVLDIAVSTTGDVSGALSQKDRYRLCIDVNLRNIYKQESYRTLVQTYVYVIGYGGADDELIGNDESLEALVSGVCGTIQFNTLMAVFGKSERRARLCLDPETEKAVKEMWSEGDGGKESVGADADIDAGHQEKAVCCTPDEVCVEHQLGSDSQGETTSATVCEEKDDEDNTEKGGEKDGTVVEDILGRFVSGEDSLILRLNKFRVKNLEMGVPAGFVVDVEIISSERKWMLDKADVYDKAMRQMAIEYDKRMRTDAMVQDRD